MSDLSTGYLIILASIGSIAFVLLWSMILLLIAFLSGWLTLARHYAAPIPLPTTICHWSFQSMALRWFFWGYNNCLTLGVTAEGLLIKVILPLRVGHKPLLIPWSEIQQIEELTVFLKIAIIKITLRQLPTIPLFFPKKILAQLQIYCPADCLNMLTKNVSIVDSNYNANT
ncbi:hypothetical protein [Beggiatoa leptomitoformis]|uniref:Uncharacterized protein n=1 Tax=Beggiatoa leptomitoformis TaxID=288004 RepID=A0A2N9YB48_9GAMM|nr:hypothetical protein [Beggiatoa leptomitoformis]ALG66941.1 hypothetical protein AL038_03430 [Beggiatoa leptomitoformis]AUI67693.1 hypothetical protein BLE401_02600 [Beggiatoa leptomitoformis]